MALSRMRTWSRVVTFSPLNALRIVTSLTLWMFLNRLRMLSSTNIFFSLLIFPSILILVVWGDGIEPSLCCSFGSPCKYRPTLPYQRIPIPARKSGDQSLSNSYGGISRRYPELLRSLARITDTRMKETRGTTIYPRSTPTASLFPSLITEWQEAESNRPPSEAFTLHVTLSRAYLPFLL